MIDCIESSVDRSDALRAIPTPEQQAMLDRNFDVILNHLKIRHGTTLAVLGEFYR